MRSLLKIESEGIVAALPPPPGVIPNFEHPESQGHWVVITTAILVPLATLVVTLRIYTRGMIVRSIGSDDYAMLLGWLLSIAYAITTIFVLKYGLGVHMWDVLLTTFSPHLLKTGIINGVFYGLSFMCVKLSMLLLYLRLSPYRPFRIMVWVVIVATVTYSVLGSFEFLFNCQPIAKNWDVTISEGSCINVAKILMTHGALNIATDIAMLVLPIALVQKLKLPVRQKVALACLFMTGTLVCIVSIIRLKSVIELVRSADFTWTGADVGVWTAIEINVGIICACLPNFKPFLRRHFPRVLGSSYHSEAVTSHFGRRTANALSNTSIGGYELEPCEGPRKSGISSAMPRKSKQPMGTENESQEDMLEDGYSKDISGRSEVATTLHDRPPSSLVINIITQVAIVLELAPVLSQFRD